MLHKASDRGHLQLVEILLQHGADASIQVRSVRRVLGSLDCLVRQSSIGSCFTRQPRWVIPMLVLVAWVLFLVALGARDQDHGLLSYVMHGVHR